MKTIILLLLSLNSLAATITATGGNWSSANSWSLNRLVRQGDTVVIPQNIIVTIEGNESTGVIYLKVLGTLRFISNGKLFLAKESVIEVVQGGVISSDGQSSEQLRIGNAIKYVGSSGVVMGPQTVDYSRSFTYVAPLTITPANPVRRTTSITELITVSKGSITIRLSSSREALVQVVNINGQLTSHGRVRKGTPLTFLLPTAGVYVVCVESEYGKVTQQIFYSN